MTVLMPLLLINPRLLPSPCHASDGVTHSPQRLDQKRSGVEQLGHLILRVARAGVRLRSETVVSRPQPRRAMATNNLDGGGGGVAGGVCILPNKDCGSSGSVASKQASKQAVPVSRAAVYSTSCIYESTVLGLDGGKDR